MPAEGHTEENIRRGTCGGRTYGGENVLRGKHTAGEGPAGDVPEYAIRQSDDFEEKDIGASVAVAGQSRCGILFPEENPGHLRLYCYRNRQENLLWYAPNVLTQIPQKQKLAMTVKLSLSGRGGR